jgi:hypothetical protein
MGRLAAALATRPPVFAPCLFRLALRLEQLTWTEVAESPGEAVFALRSLQRLFGLDAIFAGFDPWLEAEAAGAAIQRDELGRVTATPARSSELPPVEHVLAAHPLVHAVEVVRRLAAESASEFLTFGALCAGATLVDHLNGTGVEQTPPPVLENARQLSTGLARAYCEAGADALVLIEDVESADASDLELFAPVVNLANYYGVPIVLFARHEFSAAGLATLKKLGISLYITPTQRGESVRRLPPEGARAVHGLALSAWEIEPDTDPDTIHAWRRELEATPA